MLNIVRSCFQKMEIAPEKITLKVKMKKKQNVPSGYILFARAERVKEGVSKFCFHS